MSQHTAAADEPPILVEKKQGFMRVVLNRPAKLNALTEGLLIDLTNALHAAADDAEIRAVLLTGAGNAFCAGQDLNARDPRKHEGSFDLGTIQKHLFHPVIRAMRAMDKPVVAAVSGIAAGAGASIALAADIVIAGHSSRFIQSFAKVGLSVDAGGGYALTQAIGPARARGLLITAGALTGEEAAAAGLIWKSVPDEVVEAEAEAIVKSLAQGPTIAYAAIKQAVAAAEVQDFDTYLDTEAALQGKAGSSADYREGVLAFLEKRPPAFEGR